MTFRSSSLTRPRRILHSPSSPSELTHRPTISVPNRHFVSTLVTLVAKRALTFPLHNPFTSADKYSALPHSRTLAALGHPSTKVTASKLHATNQAADESNQAREVGGDDDHERTVLGDRNIGIAKRSAAGRHD